MRNETYENNNSNVGVVAVSVSEVGGYEHKALVTVNGIGRNTIKSSNKIVDKILLIQNFEF